MGEGVEEYGHVKGDPENVLVKVDPRYFRPTEVELLLVSAETRRNEMRMRETIKCARFCSRRERD